MMTYSMIKIYMLVLFCHTLHCTPSNYVAPDSDVDAVTLKKAMKGFGTDKASIIDLLVKRSNTQRQEIRKSFKIRYGKDIIDELKSELSGDFETTVVGLMLTNHQFYAKELHHALTGLGTDEKAIAEILGSLNHTEIQDIATIYQKEYGTTLKDDIIGDTSGSFQKLLVQLCTTDRKYNEEINDEHAAQDSRNLILTIYNSQYENIDKEEDILISILTNRSVIQLRKIFEAYTKTKKKDIMESVKGHFSDSLEYGLFAIIRYAYSKNDFFAYQLNEAIDGIGTNDRQLIRIIVGRSEIDLDEIKKAYEHDFGSSLVDKIAAETSGDYKSLLIAILNKYTQETSVIIPRL